MYRDINMYEIMLYSPQHLSFKAQASYPCVNSLCLWGRVSTTAFDSPFLEPQISTLRPIQDGRPFADDFFKCFSILKMFDHQNFTDVCSYKGTSDNKPPLVQIIAWSSSLTNTYMSYYFLRAWWSIWAKVLSYWILNKMTPPTVANICNCNFFNFH